MISERTTDTQPPPARNGTTRRGWRTSSLVAAVAVAFVLVGCSSAPAVTPATTPPAGQGAKGAKIAISNFMFIPARLTVHPGATVTVINRDQVAHTVTSSSGGFDTGDIQPGQSVTFTAPDRAGSFPYICSIHQYMSGTLTVS